MLPAFRDWPRSLSGEMVARHCDAASAVRGNHWTMVSAIPWISLSKPFSETALLEAINAALE